VGEKPAHEPKPTEQKTEKTEAKAEAAK
jgi:hypothetical protein